MIYVHYDGSSHVVSVTNAPRDDLGVLLGTYTGVHPININFLIHSMLGRDRDMSGITINNLIEKTDDLNRTPPEPADPAG